jgi:PAS domain S-box-containing protein
MNKKYVSPALDTVYKQVAIYAAGLSLPATSFAESGGNDSAMGGFGLAAYITIGIVLTCSAIVSSIFLRKLSSAKNELTDLTSELNTTRKRLSETGLELEVTRKDLHNVKEQYQGILFDAEVGMFQLDADGKCTYINSAMQELSGLYPKKALADGIESAVHPDDLKSFKDAWAIFEEHGEPFYQTFRFRHSKGHDVPVACRAGTVTNGKGEVESYIGWVMDVSSFDDEKRAQQALTERYENFVAETVEGYYQLTPEAPIGKASSSAKMAEAIMSKMVLSKCNDTFAAMYGASPAELIGKSVGELKDGCGPFKSNETFRKFVDSGYKAVEQESVKQDPSGNRINLLNNVVGIFEDNKLVGIWGCQRNISSQKREKAELTSQVEFMHRILNALPADIHVKDTRCRYLYASKKLADRTGVPQESWIGKTIFEVIPATPREHDQQSIDTMKSGKMSRVERRYDARGKTGWIETIQKPLVSSEGLVEGVVGLSLDMTERKQQEEKVVRYAKDCEQQLKDRTAELRRSQGEHSETSASLTETLQKLKIAEAEKARREQEFKTYMRERKSAEDNLKRSEQTLLAHQQQLEQQLEQRLQALNEETDKRMKWEELLSIKEDELRKIEAHAADISEQLEMETKLRSQSEANLETSQTSLDKYRKELDQISSTKEDELEDLKATHQKAFNSEQTARKQAERQVKKLEDQFNETQEQIKQLAEKHAAELEREVAERKEAAEKLIQSMEELDELKQQFSKKLEEETKTIKQELARKQIREKALRQHEKDLEDRIKELEKTLDSKSKEFANQIQAREGAEVQRQQAEHKLEQLNKRQQELVARETQKLNLNIAEIRLQEVKLRKLAGDIQVEKEALEDQLIKRDAELKKTTEECKRLEAELTDAKANLDTLQNDQSKVVERETVELQKQLKQKDDTHEKLRSDLNELELERQGLEEKLNKRNQDLSSAAAEYRKLVDAYKNLQSKLKEFSEDQESQITEKTEALQDELREVKKSEKKLNTSIAEMNDRVTSQQYKINTLLDNLKTESELRKKTEEELKDLQAAFDASQENADSLVAEKTKQLNRKINELKGKEMNLAKELEELTATSEKQKDMLALLKQEREEALKFAQESGVLIDQLKTEHQKELKESMAELQQINEANSGLIDELNEAVQQSLHPVLKSTVILEQAENLSADQKDSLESANRHCRKLMDSMNYRSELNHLADGTAEVKSVSCDLHELISGLDHQFCHEAEKKKLFFAVSFAQYQSSHNVPKNVLTDDAKVRKTMAILLGYALRQTTKGRIGLHAARQQSSQNEAVNIAFELTFTPAEQNDALLSDIFGEEAAGNRVDVEHGLTLAKQYIKLLGGEHKLEYREAGITALTVEFPFKRQVSGVDSGSKEPKAGAA